MNELLVEIFSEVVCLYCALKRACVTASECRTKNEIFRNTDDNDKNNKNERNKDVNNSSSKEGIYDNSVYESDSFLDTYYRHFVTLTSPPDKQLIQSFQNMKKSLLDIINYSAECNTFKLSAILPLPKHYHELLPKKIQIALKDGNAQ